MKRFFTHLAPLLITTSLMAHDEGHGPKLGDQPKFGGAVTAVIKESEVEEGRKAKLLYKAELTKNAQGIVRLYFYDTEMKPVAVKGFANGEGVLLYKKGGSKKYDQLSFPLEKKDKHFEGKLPLKPRPPFNIDVKINEGGKKLFMAFDNLN